jgi:hypothetical protein
MLIRISIEKTEPLTGTAAAGERTPVPFMGWLEMLRTISELVGADDAENDRRPTAPEEPTGRKDRNEQQRARPAPLFTPGALR